MHDATLVFLIIGSAIGVFILYKWLKPYIIKHDTTITIVGGLGSGKSLESVKKSVVLVRKQRFFKWKLYNKWSKFLNKCFILPHNKIVKKRNKGCCWAIRKYRNKPMLYSNIPINFKTHSFSRKREWSIMLDEAHLLLLKHIEEYSVVMVDELPQFINQFNWNEDLVQKNINEFITYFRHYIGGYFICNAQSINDIVVQIRRKLNQAIWCFDFKKRLFGLFYTVRMCDVMISDTMETVSTTFIEDNTKLHFGLFPPRKTYDTRCYSIRYNNILVNNLFKERWKALKTEKIIRMQFYISPLDKETLFKEKLEQYKKALALSRNPNGLEEIKELQKKVKVQQNG